MKRMRRFCPYCGAIINPDRRACSAHRDLPALDPATSKVVTSPLDANYATDRGSGDGADRA